MNYVNYVKVLLLAVNFASCLKSSFLDEKPDQALIIPTKIEELQAVLDNSIIMNGNSEGQRGIVPALGVAGSDDYYVNDGSFSGALGPSYKKIYTWDDNFYSRNYYDWSYPYVAVLYSNVVLDGVSNLSITNENRAAVENLKGSALFFRSHMFYQLSQIFAPAYDKSTSIKDYGIVLKLKADINEPMIRSSVEQTYERIIEDLNAAKDLLPIAPLGGLKSRPSRAAALGLLSRVYLSMRDYEKALKFADESLKIYDTLLDYNTISNPEGNTPFQRFNPEVIFHSCLIQTSIQSLVNRTRARVDSNLYKSYLDGDLRKMVFFRNETLGKSFKGSYDGSSTLWSGISTSELFLTRAECYARVGMVNESLNDLNKLLQERWDPLLWVPKDVTDPNLLLEIILQERRKELLFRGIRWMDIRRLNKEGANILLRRVVEGQSFELLPNSLKYTYLIPPDVMALNNNILQNKR